MIYTLTQDPDAHRQIEDDLQYIREHIARAVPENNRVALFLVGGFGRGEGGVVMREGRWRPANDYDLELISRTPIDSAFLKDLGVRIASGLGIPWVHIESHTLEKLGRLRQTMYNYDLKYASTCLDGDGAVLVRIPRMLPELMPRAEAQAIMFTRLWTFLGAFHPDMLHRPLTSAETFLMTGQISKALLAMMDALLIGSEGLYDASYRERLRRLGDIRHHDNKPPEELVPLIEWAVHYKLTPEEAPLDDPLGVLFRIRPVYLAVLSSTISSRFSFHNPPDMPRLERALFFNSYHLLKRIYIRFIKRSRWFEDFLHYNMAVIHLVDAMGNPEFISGKSECLSLSSALKHFRRVSGFRDTDNPSWTSLREEALRLREELWH